MKFFAIFLLCALALCQTGANIDKTCSPRDTLTSAFSDASFWAGVSGGKLIYELTDQNHDTFIQENPKVFVMYYHPGCGFCQQCKKDYAGAAKKLNIKGAKIVAAVDCSSKNSSVVDQKIRGYPTFLLYKDGEESEKQYSGDRSTASFVKFVNQN
ncbi:protein disulfide-isomerase 2 [Folsomia candida]|uniref:protein disulfide-isomerase 2 n=1 Tax=Folsomia candida TaxID=158441 RepID=UPI000B90A355|nr:protein disulfide-isomerase 2 [Folsomia candida]